MAFSLACDAGKTILRIEGTDSDVTWYDVANAGAGSVAVDGGGTEDPSFFVTEHVANAMYQILKNIQFGDGTNTLVFYSKSEAVYFDDGCTFTIKSEATLQLGELYGDWGIKGASWSIGHSAIMDAIVNGQSSARFKCYSSSIHIRSSYRIDFEDGNIDIRNSILSAVSNDSAGCYYYFQPGINNLVLRKVFLTNTYGASIGKVPDSIQDVHSHRSAIGFVTIAAVTIDGMLLTSSNPQVKNNGHVTINLRNPESNITTKQITYSDGIIQEQYSCDVHVTDKDGSNLEGVTITCEDKDSSQVFSVQTGADGKIAQQTITYKKWEGTDETETEYSPHKFTFSKNGYTLLVMENVTVDARINWDIEVKFPERIRARMVNLGRLAILR